MKSRRDFIKDIRNGIFSTFMVSSAVRSNPFGKQVSDKSETGSEKLIRIGIIGAENSHTVRYGEIFNIKKEIPGVEVQYVWGETDEFAENAAKRGSIPNIVKDPMDMMGKIDALIVDHRHAKYHLEAALPFVKAGIPTFIDKPFCYRVAEGREFLKIAEELKTPVTSYSTSAHSNRVLDMKEQISTIGNIQHIIFIGSADFESVWGGIFFYGVHMIEQLMCIFGEDIERVRVSIFNKKTTASLTFRSGYLATLFFVNMGGGRGISLITDKGEQKLESRIKDPDRLKPYRDMVEMFRTGKEPRSHESILKGMAILEALEKSGISRQWEKVAV